MGALIVALALLVPHITTDCHPAGDGCNTECCVYGAFNGDLSCYVTSVYCTKPLDKSSIRDDGFITDDVKHSKDIFNRPDPVAFECIDPQSPVSYVMLPKSATEDQIEEACQERAAKAKKDELTGKFSTAWFRGKSCPEGTALALGNYIDDALRKNSNEFIYGNKEDYYYWHCVPIEEKDVPTLILGCNAVMKGFTLTGVKVIKTVCPEEKP